MCIIIHKPADAVLLPSTVLRAYQRNDDGWGLVARNRLGSITVERDFGRTADESLLDALAAHREDEITIHCRIGTSGERSIVNTHPFEIADGVWMLHNGVLDVDRSTDKRFCDTYHAGRLFAAAFPNLRRELRLSAVNAAITKNVGSSKLVFIDADGIVIINEHLGFWREGIWFSNESSDVGYERFTATTSSKTHPDMTLLEDWYDDFSPIDDDRDLHAEAIRFLGECGRLDPEELYRRVYDDPMLAAEALTLISESRNELAYKE